MRYRRPGRASRAFPSNNGFTPAATVSQLDIRYKGNIYIYTKVTRYNICLNVYVADSFVIRITLDRFQLQRVQ